MKTKTETFEVLLKMNWILNVHFMQFTIKCLEY